MENYWDAFCRKYASILGTVPISILLESFFWYCRNEVESSEKIISSYIERERIKALKEKEQRERLSSLTYEDVKPCPNCETHRDHLKHCGVFIKCTKCLMEGPKTNNGNNDAHSDHMDYLWAIENWNNLPRR